MKNVKKMFELRENFIIITLLKNLAESQSILFLGIILHSSSIVAVETKTVKRLSKSNFAHSPLLSVSSIKGSLI